MLTALEKKFRKLLWIGGGIFAVLFLFFIVLRPLFCEQEPNVWAAKGYNETSYDQQGRQEFGYVITQKKEKSQIENKDFKGANHRYLPAGLCKEDVKFTDLALVLFTYFLVVVGWYTSISADATAKHTDRAYIFIKVSLGTALYVNSAGTKHNGIPIEFWNYGKTPAEIVKIRAVGKVADRPPQKLDDIGQLDTELPTGYVVQVTEPFHGNALAWIENGELEHIKEGRKFLYCVGCITYRDMFGNIHDTGFCWEYRHKPFHGKPCTFGISDNSKLNYRT